MEIIVWTKDKCKYCKDAKELLKSSDLEFEERNISKGPWTKVDLLEVVPNAQTVPQIFVDEKLIGGYEDFLRWWVSSHFNT
jgi:glutaredoxin 3